MLQLGERIGVGELMMRESGAARFGLVGSGRRQRGGKVLPAAMVARSVGGRRPATTSLARPVAVTDLSNLHRSELIKDRHCSLQPPGPHCSHN